MAGAASGAEAEAEAEAILRRMYAAFNAREIERVAEFLRPEVDWPNAFEGGRVHGHDAALAYWRRQFEQIDPTVTPRGFTTRGDGRIAVEVHQVVRALDGSLLADGTVVHVYALRDGLVERMDVEDAA